MAPTASAAVRARYLTWVARGDHPDTHSMYHVKDNIRCLPFLCAPYQQEFMFSLMMRSECCQGL